MSFSPSIAALGFPLEVGAAWRHRPELAALSAQKSALASQAAAEIGGYLKKPPALPGPSPALPGAFSPEALFGMKKPAQRAENVAKEFEAIFLRMLLKEMRESLPKTTLFGNSRAMEFFESLYDEQIASAVAQTGELGLAAVLKQRLEQSGAIAPLQREP